MGQSLIGVVGVTLSRQYSRILSDNIYKEDIPPRAIFVDTETEAIEIAPNKQDLQLLLGCYEIWLVDELGKPLTLLSKGTFKTESDFYSMLLSNAPCRVIAHNWRFDAAVLRIGARDNLSKYQYDIDVSGSIIPVEARGFTPFLVNLKLADNRVIELICNTNYYKQSLDSLGKNFGNLKGTMPLESEYDNRDTYLADLQAYCANDVKVLRRAYFFLFEFSQELANVTPGATIAMTANRVYRKRFKPSKRIQGTLNIPYITDIELDAYKGGRTDSFFTGNPSTRVFKYDVNSLYPFSMLGDIPIRYNQKAPLNQVIEALESDCRQRFLYLMDITISINENQPYSFLGGEGVKTDKGELIFPIGEYRIWCWEPMAKLLYSNGFIKTIHDAFAYNRYPMFDSYVNTLYNLREQYKIEGDKSRDLLVKILLNSLYGKFGQREYAKWEPATEYETDILARNEGNIDRFNEILHGEYLELLQIADKLYTSRPLDKPQPSVNSVMSIAGYITSKARSILFKGMQTILDNGGMVYYCDTDSIFASIPLPPNMVHDTALGFWKLEDVLEGKDTRFVAPKHYRLNDKWTIKGIRNPTDSPTHKQDIFPNFMTDLMSKNPVRRSRLESGAEITTIIKEPTGTNNKRISGGENSPTYPIVLS